MRKSTTENTVTTTALVEAGDLLAKLGPYLDAGSVTLRSLKHVLDVGSEAQARAAVDEINEGADDVKRAEGAALVRAELIATALASPIEVVEVSMGADCQIEIEVGHSIDPGLRPDRISIFVPRSALHLAPLLHRLAADAPARVASAARGVDHAAHAARASARQAARDAAHKRLAGVAAGAPRTKLEAFEQLRDLRAAQDRQIANGFPEGETANTHADRTNLDR